MKAVVVHCQRDQFDVYVGRGRDSEWGNPFVLGQDGDRAEVIAKFKRHLWARVQDEGRELIVKLAELHGKRLGCWCSPEACHGDVLAQAAEWAHGELMERPWHRAASFVDDEETSDAEAGVFEFTDTELIDRLDAQAQHEEQDRELHRWLARCEETGRVNLAWPEREFLDAQLSQARVELETLIEDAQRATGQSRAQVMKHRQVVRAIDRGVALREAYNYRRYCAALGWSTYKRIAFKRRMGTYAKANAVMDGVLRRRAERAIFTGEELVRPTSLVATRIRRRHPLSAGGRGMRAAA